MDPSIPSPTPDVLLREARFVSALARDLLSDAHAAEDLAQETWLRFLRRPPRSGAAPRGWLRAVTSRLAVEGLRGRSRRAAREERAARGEALPSVEDELVRTEVLRSVAEAVLALDEPYRTTVLLAYWRGWDARRIARETDTPLATVRSRLQRAHQTLRERLDRRHGREAWALALSSLSTVKTSGALALVAIVVAGALLAGLFLLRTPANRREPAALASASAAQEHVSGISSPASQRAEPTPAARDELGATPALLRITGTVVDRACAELSLPERPSAGLAMIARLDDSEVPMGRPPLARSEMVTDEAGRFSIELPRPAVERLVLHFAAQEDATHRRLWHRTEIGGADVELALARTPHGVLHGSVVDIGGASVAGVELEVSGVRATSGDDGTFAIANARRGDDVVLRSSGHALLGLDGGRPLDEGGFTPLRVRLGPAARLRLRASDRNGTGLAGLSLRASLPECEQAMLGTNARERVLWGTTDEEGVVLLEGVWARHKLHLVLESGREHYVCDAMDEGRLLLDAAAARGRPIVVEPGAELALEARIDVERDVAGVVRLADGAAAPRARVEVADLGRGSGWSRPALVSLVCDEAGRFAGRVRTAALVGPLRVTASAPELAPPRAQQGLGGLGYAGATPVGDVVALDMPAARLEIAPDDVEALAALVLTLDSRHAIRGRLLDREGTPLTRFGMGGSRAWAVPAGSAFHGHGVAASALAGRPGAFEITGLEPGAYDVVVSEELESFYSFKNFLHRFSGIQAGGGEVELRLPERREVRIRVRIAGGEPGSAVVLHRKLFPARPLEVPRAQRVERVAGARGWPEGAALSFGGISGVATELGQTSDGFDGIEGREHALQPLEPGIYAIGVQATGPEGSAGYYPQATPLLWFDEGEHVVEFELLPAATLRGRVAGDAAGEFLAVALVDGSGALLPLAPLQGFTHAVTIVDTSASGEFVLHRAPTGAFRVRVGTRAELERGVFRREVPVELTPDENQMGEVR